MKKTETLMELDEILKEARSYKTKSIIYFLIKDNKVVYVGQSSIGESRVYAHIRDKDFDKYHFIECEEEKLTEYECLYIIKYNPKYNKTLPPNHLFKSMQQLKIIFGMGANRLKKIIRDNGIKSVFDGNYYPVYDIKQALLKEGSINE